MAEPIEEEIIFIDESEAAGLETVEEHDESTSDESNKKNNLIIYASIGFGVFIIILIIILLLPSSQTKQSDDKIDFLEEALERKKVRPIVASNLENMIAKANFLYSTGSKDEALFLYERIAQYSEAISLYNLGVAQLKDTQYELALKTFKKAIQNDEKRCVSSINAAVCALHLKDEKTFRYYIDLAYAYLPYELNSPLYSYYYALVNYYNHNYLEALSALNNSTSNEYPNVQKHLSAKINSVFGNNYDAIEAIDNKFNPSDSFSIGLLYAKIGDLTLAQQYLTDAINKNIEPIKSKIALAFVNLKAGKVSQAASQIKEFTNLYDEEVYKPYPIKVKLKSSLFNPERAQDRYRDRINNNISTTYQKIFNFSPYKMFNANQTISYIRKGNANIYIDNINSAKIYLTKSASSSNVNQGIAKAIKKALSFNIREANLELKKLISIQPKHSILHYNLALTYAQLGDNRNAYKHFLRSYHLDAKNYLSGIYAVMSGEIISKDVKKLKSIIKDSVYIENDSEEINLYKTLLYISSNNYLAAINWLNNDYKQRPLYLALDVLIALKVNKIDYAKKSSKELATLLPNEILPHLMNIDTHYSHLTAKKYAAKVTSYLGKQDFHFNDLYYGSNISRYLYIQQNLIIGRLYFLRKQLRKVLESTSKKTHELTSALALASLYDKSFEESYTLYNHLIDNLKVRDANTLFLGAVASTAAQHHENAIVLLELSKMKDTGFLESRYALGLLYMEINNNNGASIQLARVLEEGFNSDYFDFKIDTSKLLFEKQNQK